MRLKIFSLVVISILISAGFVFSTFISYGSDTSQDLDLEICKEMNRGTRGKPNVGSIWMQDTYSDFNAGVWENLELTLDGDLKLELNSKFIADEFIDGINISTKDNLILDTINGTVKLRGNSSTYGGGNNDYANDIIQTSDGGYAIIGDTLSYGHGQIDAWLIKTDSKRNVQWSKTFGGKDVDSGSSVIQTSDGGYAIVGYTASYGAGGMVDAWLIKTDAAGNEQWNNTYDNLGTEFGMALEQTSDGGFIIGGYSENMIFNAYFLLVKTDGNGKEEWNRRFGAGDQNRCYDVIQTSDGGYAITGYTSFFSGIVDNVILTKLNDTGIAQWNKTFGGMKGRDYGRQILQTSDNGYVIVGITETYGAGMSDGWIIKTNSAGVEQWNNTFGGVNFDECNDIIKTSDGGYAITGLTESFGAGDKDVWIIKTDKNGVAKWSKTYGGINPDSGYGILQTASGGFVIAGYTESYGAGQQDFWLIQVGSGGLISTGSLKSTNLLLNEVAYTINTFECLAVIPWDTTIKVRFSQDELTWYDSSGTLDEYDTLINGNNNIDLSLLSWSGSKFYYEMVFSTNSMDIPKIDNVKLEFSQYPTDGNYISKAYNTVEKPKWKTLSWTATTQLNSDVKFQLRSAESSSDLSSKAFIGPDGEENTYYTSPGNIYSGHEPDNWIQYKVFFEITGTAQTPVLHNVSITYNRNPRLISPSVTPNKGDITMTYNFTVRYIDIDNDPPGYMKINLNGTDFTMLETNNTDTDYMDGKNYWYSTKLTKGIYKYRFYATDNELDCISNSSELEVDIGPLDHIIVEPKSTTITTDEYQIFTAKGFDADDNPIKMSPRWEVNGGGTIDSEGNFTAIKVGNWVVYANLSGISGLASINVTIGELDKIEISPQAHTITTDEYVDFNATGYDANKNIMQVIPTWDVTGGGTIDQTGKFIADTPGMWTVFANYSGISSTSKVTVKIGELEHIEVLPKYTEINVTKSITFLAKGFDADNNEVDITPTWEVDGGGDILANGKFTATTPGTWNVYAKVKGIIGDASVKVNQEENKTDIEVKKEEDKKTDNSMLYAGIGVGIIIAIVVIVILFLFLKKKRKGGIDDEEEKPEETKQQPTELLQQIPQAQPMQFPQFPIQLPYQQLQQPLPFPQPALPVPQRLCSTCNNGLIYMPQNNGFYCPLCQKYD